MHFEFSDFNDLGKLDRIKLENFLQTVWQERFIAYANEVAEEDIKPEEERKYQPFLKFDGNRFRTQNYIGFIQQDGETIEIYPKVFKQQSGISKELVLDHIFYWFSYCRKLHFPVLDTSLDNQDADTLPELLIWHFAKYTVEVLATQPYSQYEEISEVLRSPKGKIDFPAYIRNGLTTGNYHHIDCVHEPFIYDNTLNRGIKYVCRLLQNNAKSASTHNLLHQIIFQLDEVEDVACSSADLNTISLNPLFTEYAPIIQWCKRFLEQRLYSSTAYDSLQWTLLLPMEYVFEDFVAGFIQKHFSHTYSIVPQKSDLSLSVKPEAFRMRHDIYLEHIKTGEKIIIDTKYKPRWDLDKANIKQGVSQNDMYQMVSYAYRRGCNKVILLYPNTSEVLAEDSSFEIQSGFNQDIIKITICEISFWDKNSHRDIEETLKETLGRILTDVLQIG